MPDGTARADRPIIFKFAADKACAALHRMVSAMVSVDLHTALKACYFADKDHLNRYGRPVFGAQYRAMPFGPVPLEIYEMAKCEPMWLAELGVNDLPWRLTGYTLTANPAINEEPDLGVFSQSDQAALAHGIDTSVGLTFDQRTAATHGADWQAARLGMMRYEDMIADGPGKASLVQELRESAPYMRL